MPGAAEGGPRVPRQVGRFVRVVGVILAGPGLGFWRGVRLRLLFRDTAVESRKNRKVAPLWAD